MPKYVITGGPGCGKTTVVELLGQKGYTIVPESARELIAALGERGKGIDDPAQFQLDLYEMQKEKEMNASGEVFFDRSLVDVLAYCNYFGVAHPQVHAEDISYDAVFVLEMLDTYDQRGRVEDEETAHKIHKIIIHAYKEFGFDTIIVPQGEPEERVKFILERI